MAWKLSHCLHVGGVTGVGFGSNDLLLVASHAGRGVFDPTTGQRVARDNDESYEWQHEDSVTGIGPLEGVLVPVCGVWSKMPEHVKIIIDDFDTDSHVTEFKGAALTDDGMTLVIAFSDEVQIYRQVELTMN